MGELEESFMPVYHLLYDLISFSCGPTDLGSDHGALMVQTQTTAPSAT